MTRRKSIFFQEFLQPCYWTAVQNIKEKQQTGIGEKILAVKENAELIEETGCTVCYFYQSSKPALSSALPAVVKKLRQMTLTILVKTDWPRTP